MPSQVVVAFDFSHSGHGALDRAIALAVRAPFHVLHIVCVIEPHATIRAVPGKRVDVAYAARVQEAVTAEIERLLGTANVAARVQFFVHARIGKPAKEILAVARDVGADLIVIGSRGMTGVERLLVGSVSERVVRDAHCTVEVVRPKTYDDVARLELVEVEPHDHYIPPHRYAYEDRRVTMRPVDWPLY